MLNPCYVHRVLCFPLSSRALGWERTVLVMIPLGWVSTPQFQGSTSSELLNWVAYLEWLTQEVHNIIHLNHNWGP